MAAQSPSSIFIKGQHWQIGERLVKIGHVGRLLVHHRTVDPLLKRVSRESLSTIAALQELVEANKAVLVTSS